MLLPRLNQAGVIKVLPLLLIITAVGVVSFLLITSTASFHGLFSQLFPKPSSHAATNQIYWGAWVYNAPPFFTFGLDPKTSANYTEIPWDFDLWNLFESHTGKAMSLTHWGDQMPRPSSPQNVASTFDFVAARNSQSRGAIPFLDWGTDGWSDQQITSGAMDQYLKNWATSVKANYPSPIFVRFDGEMQGCW